MKRYRIALMVGTVAAFLAMSEVSCAQERVAQDYDVAPQALKYSLREIARQAGFELVAPSDTLRGKRSDALKGHFTPDEALSRLLQGTGLTAEISSGTIYIRGRSGPPPQAVSERSDPSNEILVTGSRIRGAPTASPTITISQQEMADTGLHDLGDVVRSIPQNFGGGQNPAIGPTTPVSSGESIGAGSSINLRGLGQDATLTLLNGHRLTNGGNRQSIDVSAIPIGAVSRIEIVADGASALFGSDAVAGVANVILKRDYQGLSTTARFGAATDGGMKEQQYDAVAGRKWSTGGIIAAYNFQRSTEILGSQRSYTATSNPTLIIYPFIKRHNALVSAHQDILPGLTFSVDALYGWRADRRGYSFSTAATAPVYVIRYKEESFSVAPSLQYAVGGDWILSLDGTYGQDHTRYHTTASTPTATTTILAACYCNSGRSIELKADGSLFSLPAGNVKIAVGGGYRRDGFHAFRTVTTVPQNIVASQHTYYGFGELSVPLISPAQGSALGYLLNLSAAFRYEDYPGIDRVATPKFGIIYAPSPDLELRGSWGKSFKAPTLFQQNNGQIVQATTASFFSAPGAAANASALVLIGGRQDLEAERATTWSTTLALHPGFVPNLNVEVSYFDVRYRDRVVQPIAVLAQALTNPAYAMLVNNRPTAADVAAATSDRFFLNVLPFAYNPANVVAIIDDRNLNVATQHIKGVDLSLRYRWETESIGDFSILASGSYLDSNQRLNAVDAPVQLSGTYYNPPHFRARGGFIWKDGDLTLSSILNRIGGVDDVRYSPVTRVSGMTTLDLAARYLITSGPALVRNLEVSLSVSNALNDKPFRTRSSSFADPAYDSTNYSPVGRFVSFGITKTW